MTSPAPTRWRAAAPAWITARALVLAGGMVAAIIVHKLLPGQPRTVQLRQGLFAWDGAYYRDIGWHGYGSLPKDALRFFPLFPLLGRVVSIVFLGRVDIALVVIANAAALAAGLVVYRLVRFELGEHRVAERAVWLLALFPSAFVFVLAYTEPLMVLTAAAAMLAMRQRRFTQAAVWAFMCALSRPLGIAIAGAAAVEALRAWPASSWRARLASGAAVIAPALGLLAFLLYARAESGDFFAPFRVQEALRGATVDPITRVLRSIGDLAGAQRLADGLHAPFAILLLVLVVLAFRWLPASYGVYCSIIGVAALAADNLNSLERYMLDAFPLIVVLAMATEHELLRRATITVSAALMLAFTVLAFTGAYVP